jgi:hypothetical protein
MEWRSRAGVDWLEAKLGAGVRAAFSTRIGGVSTGAFESLNLGLLTGDDGGGVVENRRRLIAALGLDPAQIQFGHQVHGSELVVSSGPQSEGFTDDPPATPPRADGQVTRDDALAPLVLVADCLPVALEGPDGVAMLHCGWRGLAADIVARGAAATAASSAAIGPGIGPCCYEVGEGVLDAFSHLGEGIADGRRLDLPEVARRLLLRAGVDRVEVAGICTSCEAERFFSHRRDGRRSGRQAGVAWRAPEGEV